MLAKVLTCAIVGLEGAIVEAEVDVSPGLLSFTIVGLPDTAVQEARERVRAAIRNSGCWLAATTRKPTFSSSAGLRSQQAARDGKTGEQKQLDALMLSIYKAFDSSVESIRDPELSRTWGEA